MVMVVVVGWVVGRVQARVIVCGRQLGAHLVGADGQTGYVVIVVGCDGRVRCLGGVGYMGRVGRVHGGRLGSRDCLGGACGRVMVRVRMMRVCVAKRMRVPVIDTCHDRCGRAHLAVCT